jgi:hypothetical protein
MFEKKVFSTHPDPGFGVSGRAGFSDTKGN